MPVPILLPLAAGAAALYFLLSGGKKSTVKKEKDGRVSTVVPTVDGKGYKLTTTPADLNAIMAMAATNDAQKMTVMAAQYMKLGKVNEAIACNHLAAVIATHAATGGKPVSPKTASTSTAAASAPTTQVAATPDPALVGQLTAALGTADPAKLRELADKFEKAGFPAQAASIRAAADQLEEDLKKANKVPVPPPDATQPGPDDVDNWSSASPGIAATPPQLTPMAQSPAAVTPTLSLPTLPVALPTLPTLPAAPAAAPAPAALPAPVPQAPATPRRKAADALVKELGVRRPPFGQENQSIVRAYETALGQTASGKYGIGLAHTLAEPESGSHVPPPVRYWPASAASIAKYGNYIRAASDYDAWLQSNAADDPARAAEWQDAYQHARDFWPSGSKPQPRK